MQHCPLIQRYFGPLALVLPTTWVVTVFGLTPHLSQLWGPTFQPCTQRTPRPICTTDGLHFQPPASKKGQKGKCCPFSCGHNRKQLPFPTRNQKSVFLLGHLPALTWVYICPREWSPRSASLGVRWKWLRGSPCDSFLPAKGRFKMGKVGPQHVPSY